jgi:hypothetical protein
VQNLDQATILIPTGNTAMIVNYRTTDRKSASEELEKIRHADTDKEEFTGLECK